MSQHHQDDVEKRRLDTDQRDPAIEVAEVISDLENKETRELSTVWNCIDGMIDNLFSNPPSQQADVQVSFNYEGYRVTVDQRGTAWFEKQNGDSR